MVSEQFVPVEPEGQTNYASVHSLNQMAPCGHGRGRGRGYTSTHGPKTNPNDPVNFMTVLQNMAAAMQVTTEALEQQMNNHNHEGNNGNETQGPMMLATFLKVNPLKFKPIQLRPTLGFKQWNKHCKRSWCPKSSASSLPLICSPGNRRIGGRAPDVSYKKYFPNSARTIKELELLQLKQDAMSISEYIDKFEELFRFSHMCQGAPGDFEEWKCIKYEGGLRSDILSSVEPMEIRSFPNM
ncbi:uncharacterized protein LOC130980398 [Arachis stenosperma]|uniref:uncharacterized protein LOC130980398 n=1 Tax=Arachis stenosperma TaxID=217475 RepID=UPI0025ABCD7A|nr:uncharacterized protein LOC130980398 [Arachis stenosperma]